MLQTRVVGAVVLAAVMLDGPGGLEPRSNLVHAEAATREAVGQKGAGATILRAPHIIDVTAPPFNAVCDGVTDDSAALQAAFDAASADGANRAVLLPPRTCAFARRLVAGGDRMNPYYHVSVYGVSEDTSILKYIGPMSGDAITLRHVAYFRWENLTVTSAQPSDFSAHGTATGIRLDGSLRTGGTQTLAGTFTHLAVSGFRHGMVYGGGDAASEIECHHCIFSNNDVGWTATGYNSLNFHFFQLEIGSNTRGLEIGGDGRFGLQATDGPHIYGGASGNNTEADFLLGNNFGVVTIENFRAEPRARFVKVPASGLSGQLTLRGNTSTPQTTPGDGIVVELQNVGNVLLEQNQFGGLVAVGGTNTGAIGATLVMRQNRVPAFEDFPVKLASATTRGLHLVLENNTRDQGGAPASRAATFPDFIGSLTSGRAPWLTSGRDTVDPPGGGLRLHAVRTLGYGTAAAGRNLRDRVKFTGRGTQPFTFKRTVTVTTRAGDHGSVTFAPGTITPADVGKTLVLPGVNNSLCAPPATSDNDSVDARIVALTSDTRATIALRAWSSPNTRCEQAIVTSGTIVNATIGEDEPDANYFLLLGCDAQETISWSAKSAAGFTLTSSNPTSTATCDVFIVR